MKKPHLLLWLAVVGLFVASCSVPTDNNVTAIDEALLPESLQETTTTTTSTTLPGEDLQRRVFFLLREVAESVQREVQQVELDVPKGTVDDFIGQMFEEGFALTINEGREEPLVNQLVAYDEFVRVGFNDDTDTATVYLRHEGEEPGDQTLKDVAAQLLWTLTTLDGIEQISININDQLVNLPTTNEDTGSLEAVSRGDYLLYDGEVDISAPTTTLEPVATTTVPPEEDSN
ncbi:MAG: hypothetical protein ACI9C1_000429 [Candidatus Aldehydirespiratoraceae bacterium]|jgi:hypothetical protein